MYVSHIRPTWPNGNRGNYLLVYGSRFPTRAIRTRRVVSPCSQACAGCVRGIAASAVGSHAAGRSLALFRPLIKNIPRDTVLIVLASDAMHASAVEAVDTAHHCSSQRSCLGRMCQCGASGQLVSSRFHCPRQSVVDPDV